MGALLCNGGVRLVGDARGLIGFLERGGQRLAPFQRRFITGAMAPGIRKAVLSGPRGLGKSSLTGELLAAAVDPAGPLFRPGGESVLLASSLEQARVCFGFLRRFVGEDGFRYQDSRPADLMHARRDPHHVSVSRRRTPSGRSAWARIPRSWWATSPRRGRNGAAR